MRIEDLRKSFENLNFSVRLSNWEKEDLYDFILSALTVMSMWTESKLNYFWKNGEEESALEGWIDCLEIFTANAIITTLESVRDGNYKKYEDLIPRSAIDFKHFILNGNHKKSSIYNYPISKMQDFHIPDKSMERLENQKLTPQRNQSQEIARENLKKIREILKDAFVRII